MVQHFSQIWRLEDLLNLGDDSVMNPWGSALPALFALGFSFAKLAELCCAFLCYVQLRGSESDHTMLHTAHRHSKCKNISPI